MTMTCRVTPIAALCAVALSTACGVPKSDSLGEVDDASSSGSADDDAPASSNTASGGPAPSDTGSGSPTEPGPTSDSVSASDSGGSDSETGDTPVLPCEPGFELAYPAACPTGNAEPLQMGCYAPCEGPGASCAVGTCTLVEINPCPCEDDAVPCCEACAGDAYLCLEDVGADACDEIVGTVFESVEQHECGITPKGVVLCNWRIIFEKDGEFLWQYSDVGEGGDYTCEGGILTVTNGPMIDATYDPLTQILTWDGVDYVPEA